MHYFSYFLQRLSMRGECQLFFFFPTKCAHFVDGGQAWWVHAKVISPSIHLCQRISLGNSPKCGNSLGTDWCRRVKEVESECMCVLLGSFVRVCVCACVCLGANSKANRRKILLSNSALVFFRGMSPVRSSIDSLIIKRFGHQIPPKR